MSQCGALDKVKVAVVGLGYVGLPLAAAFGRKYGTIGFDIKAGRVAELKSGHDSTQEMTAAEMAESSKLVFSCDATDLADRNLYIVTVPTPIDESKQPDLTPLVKASEMIAGVLSTGDTVVYESTVYPGATEEVCVPILEKLSGLVFNQDFYVGYSPERINPGDKTHRLESILKVTSGSTPETADFVDSFYASIITAGTHKASSIKVAEAAKVIENTQRDLNIALINELAIIFDKLGIDTGEVLAAAGTKWNFLPFRPGLVGGHCISIDPYYLTHKAQSIGYHPEIILAGRRLNDGMGAFVVSKVIKLMTQKKVHVVGSKVLIMGLTFKENCPDLRNTRVIDMVRELSEYHAEVDVYDPWADSREAQHEYGIELVSSLQPSSYDAIILAVSHHQFAAMSAADIRALGKSNHVLYDIKHLLAAEEVDGRL
ncbi:MAG: Vi polysaccharide biosynthesis UDP-N-acetylglucosamine C-6 dehydrogenase TviB [Motiliproteus sp.]